MEFGKLHRIFRSHRSRPGNRCQIVTSQSDSCPSVTPSSSNKCSGAFSGNVRPVSLSISISFGGYSSIVKSFSSTALEVLSIYRAHPLHAIRHYLSGSHFQPLHIGISQGCRNQGNEQPGMIQKESKLLPSEWKSDTKRGQPLSTVTIQI